MVSKGGCYIKRCVGRSYCSGESSVEKKEVTSSALEKPTNHSILLSIDPFDANGEWKMVMGIKTNFSVKILVINATAPPICDITVATQYEFCLHNPLL